MMQAHSFRLGPSTHLALLAAAQLAAMFVAVVPAASQEQDDYHAFGYCAGYFSKELKMAKSGASAAALKAESDWYQAKLASLDIPPLWKANALDFGSQLYGLDIQRSGGPPTDQIWRERRHAECAEIAVRLFPDAAGCFEKSGEGAVFTCKPTQVSTPQNEPKPRDSQDRNFRHTPPGSDPNAPSAVYQEFLDLRNKRQWSKMFDLFDADSQHRCAESMRQMVSSIAPEVAESANSMSDREVFVTFFQAGKDIGETRINAEHVTGDVAVLETKVKKNKTWYDADPPVELHKTNGKWMMYWPR